MWGGVLALWWTGLCPKEFMCSGSFKAADLLVGQAVSLPSSLLSLNILVLLSTGWWARISPGAAKLEGGFHMALASASVHVVEQAPQDSGQQCLCLLSCSCLLPPGRPSKSTGRWDSGSFLITAYVHDCVRFCVHPLKSGVSISPQPLGL